MNKHLIGLDGVKKLPAQVYKPIIFWTEVNRILRDTQGAWFDSLQGYLDADGNVFRIDFDERVIEVNPL